MSEDMMASVECTPTWDYESLMVGENVPNITEVFGMENLARLVSNSSSFFNLTGRDFGNFLKLIGP